MTPINASRSALVSGLAISVMLTAAPRLYAADETKKPEAPAAKPAQPATKPLKLGGPGIEQERSFPKIVSGKWTGPKTADGQPDVQGPLVQHHRQSQQLYRPPGRHPKRPQSQPGSQRSARRTRTQPGE